MSEKLKRLKNPFSSRSEKILTDRDEATLPLFHYTSQSTCALQRHLHSDTACSNRSVMMRERQRELQVKKKTRLICYYVKKQNIYVTGLNYWSTEMFFFFF